MKHLIAIILVFLTTVFTFAQGQQQSFETRYIDGEPKLEIIEARQVINKAQPLLLVHGYRMGAWIFEDNYLPFFFEKGYDVFAINLRGHGWSEGAEDMETTTLDEYYVDLERAVAYIQSETGEQPLLIGYAMGAVLTQKYIYQNHPEAAILLGMGDIRTALSHYQNWSKQQFPGQQHAKLDATEMESMQRNPDFQRALFFNDQEKPEGYKKYITQLVIQDDSKAIWADLENFIAQPVGNTEVLIVAGDQDPFTPPTALQRTRRLYNAQILMLENTRHGIPIGENWKKGAKGILKFLRQLPENKERGVSLLGVEMIKN